MFMASTYLIFFYGRLRGKANWFKRAGVYCMIFKVPSLRGEIGDPLDIYIVLSMIFHLPSHFLERVERK